MKGTINDLMVMHFAREDYKVSDEADNGSDANIKYIGYVNRDGEWYILERNLTNRTYRFIAGASNYTAGWAGREAYTYERYDEVFGE